MAHEAYMPAIPLGDVIRSSACGEVLLSRDPHFVVEGFENAPTALARLFKGENMGKQLVKIV